MYGGRFIVFFSAGRSTNTEYYESSNMLVLIPHSRIKVSYSHPVSLWDSNPRFQIDTLSP